jgi:hypothetical protein
MRTNTFGRIPFNTDNRPLPATPYRELPREPRPDQRRLHPTVPFSTRRDGAGPAFLQRPRSKRIS